MPSTTELPSPPNAAELPAFGARLRLLRRVLGVKQLYVARLAGVAQTTVSRWESGALRADPRIASRLLDTLSGKAEVDQGLRRLVESSPLPIHLIRDDDHRLLALSPARAAGWPMPAARLVGRSLWRYATPEIVVAEGELEARGWWSAAAPEPVRLRTSDNGSDEVRIRASTLLWERLRLCDGTPVRLCTTLV